METTTDDANQRRDKLKAYLKMKLHSTNKDMARLNREYYMIRFAFGSTIAIGVIAGALVASLSSTIPPLGITIIGVTVTVSTGLSAKFSWKKKKVQLQNELNNFNTVQGKLQYILAVNGDLKPDEYEEILTSFRDF